MLSLIFALGASRPRYHRHKISYYSPAASNALSIGTVTDTQDGLNIRTGPSINNDVIANVRDGTQLQLTRRNGEWWQVSFNGRIGYVKSEWVHIPAVVSTTDDLNIRSGPGTEFPIVGKLGNGAQIVIKGINGKWDKIDQGWVHDDFVEPRGSGGGRPS